MVHCPTQVIIHFLTVSAEALVGVEEGAGLDHEAVLLGTELLTGHVAEGEAQHQGYERIVAVRFERGHVFSQGIFVGACHQTVVAVQDAESQVVRISGHQPHQESVVSHIIGSHDDQIEQVPHRVAVDILDDKFPDKIVCMVGISVVEGGQ